MRAGHVVRISGLLHHQGLDGGRPAMNVRPPGCIGSGAKAGASAPLLRAKARPHPFRNTAGRFSASLGLDKRLSVGRRHVGTAHEQDQHENGHNERDHRDQLGGDHRAGAEHDLQARAHAEQQAGPHRALGTEFSEDDCGDGDEALSDNGRGAA